MKPTPRGLDDSLAKQESRQEELALARRLLQKYGSLQAALDAIETRKIRAKQAQERKMEPHDLPAL